MTYLVLARKYRPKTFDDLVGQESVSRGLTQAIKGGRIGHAFLFIGSRGTGKTSSARILARALNCVHGPTPTPCGECDSCRAIEDGSDIDVLEIDAASNNGVENVRELRESIAFAPMRGRFRITILDEVHMLSGGAFNALLKTLEEPPAHAKFIFATTAPEKIPDTIRSRCQVFEFRRIDENDIVKRLQHVCEKEGVRVAAPLLAAIARTARGGMRDSLSLLDQLLAYAGGAEPTEADLQTVTGAAGRDTVWTIAEAVLAGDRPRLLKTIAEHVQNGGEALEILDQTAEHFRALATIQICGADTDLVNELGAVREKLVEQAKRCEPDRCEAITAHLVFARERARSVGPLARAAVESALLAASHSGEVATISSLLERLDALERRLASAPARPAATPSAASSSQPAAAAPAQSGGAAEWLELIASKVGSFGRTLKDHCVRARVEGGALRVVVRPPDAVKRAILADATNRNTAERALQTAAPGLKLEIEFDGSVGAPRPQAIPSAAPPTYDAPAASEPAPSPAARRDPSPAVKFVLELDPDARILAAGHKSPPKGNHP